MRIERFFFSDKKEEWKRYIERVQESLSERNELDCMDDEEDMGRAVDEMLAPIQTNSCIIVDPGKYCRFCALAEESVSLAEELGANLLIDTEDFTGCIAFVCEEMNLTKEMKSKFERFAAEADEVHIKLSSDFGENSPTDIEGMIQLEYWFDYYQCVQIS